MTVEIAKLAEDFIVDPFKPGPYRVLVGEDRKPGKLAFTSLQIPDLREPDLILLNYCVYDSAGKNILDGRLRTIMQIEEDNVIQLAPRR